MKAIRVKNPVLLALNHPNAFMDPIGFSCLLFYPRSYYMARGDAFKKGIVTTILTSVGIIPIFRMRDAGIEGVKKNNASFSIAYRLWNKNRKIMVFAEGLCIQERRLRPIQKGTARMAFGFMEEYKRDDLLIVPVGVHYSHPSKFRGDFYCEAGEAIAAKDYFELYKENPAKAVNHLTKVLEEKMKNLVPHLLHKENDILIEELQEIYKHQFITEHHLTESNLEHQQVYWFKAVELLNTLTEQHPEGITRLRELSAVYTKSLSQIGIEDINVYRALKNDSKVALSTFILIVGFPLYAIGKLLNFLPWYIAKSIAKKSAKNIEFYTSVNYVVSTFISLFSLIAELLIIWLLFKNWLFFPIYIVLKTLISLLALSYSANKKRMLGELKLSSLRKSNPKQLTELQEKRTQILRILTGK